MQTMLKIVIFLLIAVLVCQCRKDEPSPVVNIPDDNFLNALIELGVDTNGDGVISPYEAVSRASLDVSSKGISDMTGIEAFGNLRKLICLNNQLNILDVSNNTILGVLNSHFTGVFRKL